MKINPKKIKAVKMRKSGKSYSEIANLLNVNKSTIAYWFKGIDWSRDIKEQLTQRANEVSAKRLIHLNNLKKIKWETLYKKAEQEAIKEFNKFKSNPLFLVGVSIYWGEGDKVFKNGIIRVSNVDYRLLDIFRKFLEETCNILPNKIKVCILVYPDLNSDDCLNFWSKNVNISKDQFIKPVTIKGRHKNKKTSYGVCIVYINNKYLKKKMLKWIDLLSINHTAGVVQW